MITIVRVPYLAVACLLPAVMVAPGVQAQTLAELDAFWAEMSR